MLMHKLSTTKVFTEVLFVIELSSTSLVFYIQLNVQNPKNSFVSAARHGASETIEGALSSSVWGKAPSLGTGSNFGVLWQAKVLLETRLNLFSLQFIFLELSSNRRLSRWLIHSALEQESSFTYTYNI